MGDSAIASYRGSLGMKLSKKWSTDSPKKSSAIEKVS
jgi:hypothetical protein